MLANQRGMYGSFVKRLIDVTASALLLVILSPVLAASYIAVWRESGRPVMFRQCRVGLDGAPFDVLKFRTMIPERRRFPAGISFPDDRRRRHKTDADPRVTRVGAVLRRYSIDELPQLINVLRGDMSLVGPRPELPHLVGRYDDWQHARHIVRPGMTGWWQVNGRSNRPMHESTELDIYYVEHMSLWLDIRILVRTPFVVGKGHGAY